MSETRNVVIPKETVRKLKNISTKLSRLNTGTVGDEFWLATGGGGGYEWSQFDIGVNKNKQLLTCEQGGCSCNGPEEPTDDSPTDLGVEEIVFEDGYEGEHSEAVEDLIPTVDTLYKVLNNKGVDAKEVIGLPNSEIRRAVVELIGYEKIVDIAEVLDESTDGKLLSIHLKEDEDIVLVHVKDPSTDRQYFLRVPPKMKTAKQARAWTFGFEEKDFDLKVES
jgi:hypothetical protein